MAEYTWSILDNMNMMLRYMTIVWTTITSQVTSILVHRSSNSGSWLTTMIGDAIRDMVTTTLGTIRLGIGAITTQRQEVVLLMRKLLIPLRLTRVG